ncbi:unnamed protein product [Periconia digitata]|uniref:Uncharacterized protein n=1 Tax=Periconia digitata TaxID=1303443 RepID=A0A9W4XHD4_9PLEO|nr:unnamed protein product [Periconia digitata]
MSLKASHHTDMLTRSFTTKYRATSVTVRLVLPRPHHPPARCGTKREQRVCARYLPTYRFREHGGGAVHGRGRLGELPGSSQTENKKRGGRRN